MAGSGPVALVGAGEFLPSMDEIDAELLGSLGPARPRVAIVPTASYPDGEEAFRRWAAMGVEHFGGLGAEVEAVLIRDRSSADDPAHVQAIGEADLVYFSGGKARHLLESLAGSAAEQAMLAAHRRGAALAGCSAGAMVLAGRQADMRRNLLPWPLRWLSGLGIVPGVAVFPHYDAMPEAIAAAMALQAPRGVAVLGIDESTALVGRHGGWLVHGPGRVTVWHGRRRDRYRAGEPVPLPSN
jgi:cyanophycinase